MQSESELIPGLQTTIAMLTHLVATSMYFVHTGRKLLPGFPGKPSFGAQLVCPCPVSQGGQYVVVTSGYRASRYLHGGSMGYSVLRPEHEYTFMYIISWSNPGT